MADSAAQQFALFAETKGWTVKRVVEDEGDTKRVEATSPSGEVVTAEWFKNAAKGPIGIYRPADAAWEVNIRNQASARRILAGVEKPQPPKQRGRPSRQPKEEGDVKPRREPGEKRVPKSNLNWDPYKVTDEEILAVVAGRSITWENSMGYETGRVPPMEVDREILDRKSGKTRTVRERNKHLFISVSTSKDTEGERILNFCDAIGGFRAAYVAAIVEVG